MLARLRRLCLSFPGATEKLSHGEPTWFLKKVFVTFSDHHHDDRPSYVGGKGWIGVRLDVPDIDWDEIAKRLIAELDARD